MGADKATLLVGDVALARRAAGVLAEVADPVLAVGPEAGTGLETVSDPRRGPLVAFVHGGEALAAGGFTGPILLLACDLPFVASGLLAFMVEALGEADAAVPVVGGRDQPLAACYAPRAVPVARDLVEAGTARLRRLLEVLEVRRLPEPEWAHVAPPSSLFDVDTPADLDAARRMAREV